MDEDDRWRDDSPMPGECPYCGRRTTFVGSCDCRSAWDGEQRYQAEQEHACPAHGRDADES